MNKTKTAAAETVAPKKNRSPKSEATKDECAGHRVTARIRPEEILYLRILAKRQNVPLAIAAGVVANAGESALRSEQIANAVGRTCGNLLWTVIHREVERFSESSEVVFPAVGLLDLHEADAVSLGRKAGDYVGSLIEIGVQIFTRPQALGLYVKSLDYAFHELLVGQAAFAASRLKGGVA